LGPLAGRVFRIGLMGYGSTADNALPLLDALEEALAEQGHHPAASGIAAAEIALDAAR